MSVDTKLFIDPSFTVEDIVTILKSWPEGENVTVRPTYTPYFSQINLIYKGDDRTISVFTNTKGYGFSNCTLLSLKAYGAAVEIFTRIANIVGGFLNESDTNDQCTKFQGMMSPEDGLPYFLRQAMLTGAMKHCDDARGLQDFIDGWYAKYGRNNTHNITWR